MRLRKYSNAFFSSRGDVDDFVDAKASDFNQFQQARSAGLQTIQSKAFKFRRASFNFNKDLLRFRDQAFKREASGSVQDPNGEGHFVCTGDLIRHNNQTNSPGSGPV
jgi:hypothetical protein